MRGIILTAKYRLRFWFEWMADTAFQSANDPAAEAFNIGMIPPETLPLKPETIERIRFMSRWHDGSLNWGDPPAPSPWRQDECDRFNAAAKQLFDAVVAELGADFEVINTQEVLVEDPDLDEYLRDPKAYRRKQ